MTEPIISMIAAMTKDRVIGDGDKIPWHIPEDFKYFKEQTLNKPIIMGRTTFESIHNMKGTDPHSGPALPKRENIVITRQASYNVRETRVCHSIEDALKLAKQSHQADEIMVLGGGTIYEQALPYADRLYITWIDGDYTGDTFFPDFNRAEWHQVKHDQRDGYAFNVYERLKP